jgi:surface protein
MTGGKESLFLRSLNQSNNILTKLDFMKKLVFISLLVLFGCEKDPVQYNLSVISNPIDGGLVNPSRGLYNAGETVSIVTVPNDFFVFEGWSGDWTGDDLQFTITMDSDKNIIANYNDLDIDRDGILNNNDSCPGTVSGSSVDGSGCALSQKDSDNDGFNDEIDACPNGPIGPITGSNGCRVDLFYLAENGVTVKAIPEAEPGMSESFNGKTYTLVSEEQLREIVNNYNYNDNKYYGKFTIGDISNIVTSSVTNMSYLFKGARVDQFIMGWDVSNVTDMSYMFNESSVGSGSGGDPTFFYWDVSNVEDFESMFQDAIILGWSFNIENNKLALYNWDTSSATNMMNMFKISTDNYQLIENYFYGYSELIGVEDWDVSNVTNMMGIFEGKENFNQNVSSWDVSSVTNMNNMFKKTNFNQDLSSWDVVNVTSCGGFSLFVDGWTLPKPNFTNCSPD